MAELLGDYGVSFTLQKDAPGAVYVPAGARNAIARSQDIPAYVKDFALGALGEWGVYHWLRLTGRDATVGKPSRVKGQDLHNPDLRGALLYHVKSESRRGTAGTFMFQHSALGRIAPTKDYPYFPLRESGRHVCIGVSVRADTPIDALFQDSELDALVNVHVRLIAPLGEVYHRLRLPNKSYFSWWEKDSDRKHTAKWALHLSDLAEHNGVAEDPGPAPYFHTPVKPKREYVAPVDPLALDTETELFSPGSLAPPMVCVSLSDGGGKVIPHLEAEGTLRAVLVSDRTLVGLNMAYDMAVICSEYPDLVPDVFEAYRAGRVRDVMLDQKLIDIAQGQSHRYRSVRGGYSMRGLAKRLLGQEVSKEDTPRLEYGKLRGCPLSDYTEGEVEYARQDAVTTLALHLAQERINADWMRRYKASLFTDAPAQAWHAFSLHLASCWGVRTDRGRCAELEASLAEEIRRARGLLQAHGLVRVDGTRDMKAARARMEQVCARKGVEPARTPKGGIKLDQEATGGTGDQVLQAYSTFVGANTLRTRVEDLTWGTRETLHPAYRSLMDTGRTSCSKPGSPLHGVQIQNMPRIEGSRECLTPRTGYIYVSADYTAAEMYGLAQSCKDLVGHSKLGDLLMAGQDPHIYLGAELYGMTYEEVEASPDKKKIRQAAKPLSFGAPGGLGAPTFVKYAAQYGVDITEEQAREHLELYKRVYPEVSEYLQYCSDHLETTDRVYYWWCGRWRGGLIYTNMANGFFQARIADAALHALDLVQLEAYTVADSPLYGSRPWGMIHDEILMETPLTQAPAAAKRLSELMEQAFKVYHPDYPTVAEPAIHWRWSKGVEPRYENGELVISDPENAPAWAGGQC